MPSGTLYHSSVLRRPGARPRRANCEARPSDLAINVLVALARAVAPLLAVTDAILRPQRTRLVAAAVRRQGGGAWSQLCRIWLARVLREAFRFAVCLGLEDAALRRIVLRGNVDALRTPAVFAIYHSPWGRLLGHWLSRFGRVVLLAGSPWAPRAAGAHVESSARGMRRLLHAIAGGRSAAVTIDHFWEPGRIAQTGCVLGIRVSACVGAARIAARAEVPLVPVSLRWTGSYLEVGFGHRFTATRESVHSATAAILAEFDAAVHADLSSWANAHRFLSGALGARSTGVRRD